MVKRNSGDRTKDRITNYASSSTVETQEPANYRNAVQERQKQELAYYYEMEKKLNGQILKELNAMLSMIRMRPEKLCQLDRQYLLTKLSLIESKIRGSDLAENQIRKILAVNENVPIPPNL